MLTAKANMERRPLASCPVAAGPRIVACTLYGPGKTAACSSALPLPSGVHPFSSAATPTLRLRGAGPKGKKKEKKQSKPSVSLNFAASLKDEEKREKAEKREGGSGKKAGKEAGKEEGSDPQEKEALDMSDIKVIH